MEEKNNPAAASGHNEATSSGVEALIARLREQGVEAGYGPISANTSRAMDGIAMPSTTEVTI